MILLFGGSGYIGSAFAAELTRRKIPFWIASRHNIDDAHFEFDYSRFPVLLEFLKSIKPKFIINAAGYTGKPNVDACENARAETIAGNTLLPATIAHAAAALDIPWGHVSSGCIYSGAKILRDGNLVPEKDLLKPEVRQIVENSPDRVHGFTEEDAPNFSFRDPPVSFYSGSKALGEEAIQGVGRNYIWRLRIPFDAENNPRNYLTKIQAYPKVYENFNAISHRGDFARACIDLWESQAAFGTYNITNPGFISTREVVALIQKIRKPGRKFEFWENDQEFYKIAAKTPRSNCILSVKKLEAAGVSLRPVHEALEHSLANWKD